MFRTITLIAVVGTTSSALGQGFSLSTSDDVLAPGDTVTITLSFSNGDRVLDSGGFGFTADNEIGTAAEGVWNFPGQVLNPGTPDGASLNSAFYLQLLPHVHNTRGDVFSFEWTATDIGLVTIELAGVRVRDGDLGGSDRSLPVSGFLDTITLEVIPTPASTTVLGLGGLVAARRRR